jgi:hypothetical protein
VNAVQVRGTHNSYQPPLPPLERQLDEGIRQLELDVWAQPDGRFAVYHSLADRRSTCPTLDVCLAPVRAWLDAHRLALPVFLIVEDKDGPAPEAARQLDTLDATLRTALPGRLLLRPDEVAGGRWPTLAQTRGRVVPILIGDLADAYSRNGSTLAGRSMLVYASSGPLAAIASRPDPVAQASDIAALVRAGLVVRTQADGDNLLIDEHRRAAAVESGAQLVSARDDGFLLPGRVSARCDPLVRSPCRPGDLEPTPTTTTAGSS